VVHLSDSNILAHLTTPDWQRLLEAILSETANVAWLAGTTGNILLSVNAPAVIQNAPHRRSDNRPDHLPVLAGPHVELNLPQLVRKSLELNEPTMLDTVQLYWAQGVTKDTSVKIVPLPPGQIAIVTLACDPRQLEHAIQQVHDQSLQSLTELAARIAHELNNPLDGSIRYISLALQRLQKDANHPDPAKLHQYLSSAKDALGKINEILSDLGLFARTGQARIKHISVNELIDQAVKTICLRAQRQRISIITVLADQLPEAGSPKLYQVFCNLIKNAIDAIEDRRRRDPDCPSIITIRTEPRGQNVLITVQDTGAGLPDDRSMLFQPFFTTRADRGGTGLGLAIAHEIVDQCAGTIHAEPRNDHGATFVIELPAAQAATAVENGENTQ